MQIKTDTITHLNTLDIFTPHIQRIHLPLAKTLAHTSHIFIHPFKHTHYYSALQSVTQIIAKGYYVIHT